MTTSVPIHVRLREMVAAAARIAAAPDADAVLLETASVLMENLGMETAAINRLVLADDEYRVTGFLGTRDDSEQILNSRARQEFIEHVMLDPAYTVLPDVFLIPPEAETMTLTTLEMETLASVRPPIDAPDAWRDHALFLALRGRGGDLLAVLSLDDPVDGLLPSEDALARAALLLHHGGTALEARLVEREATRAHEEATALASIASSLDAGVNERELLRGAAQGACDACGYASAVVSILSANGEVMEKVAVIGEHLQMLLGVQEPTRLIRGLMQPEFLLSSSYLLTGEQVVAAGSQVRYRAAHGGRGRRGWRDNYLLVPIRLAQRQLLGVLEVDDPLDRMIPSLDRLRLLEAFAQQIALVLDASRRLVEAQEAAAHDPLTKLPNRSRIFERIEAALAADASSLTILFIDIDGLKAVNDTHGHEAGDHLLVAVSRRLQTIVRAGDTVGRLSGDEFVLVCPGMATHPAVNVLANRTLESIAGPFRINGIDVEITASIGLAMASPGISAETLVRNADAAMYRSKAAGRNRATGADGGR